jgi:hypothetical protein
MEEAAIKYRLRGKATVAQDIVEMYFDLWLQLQEVKLGALEKQHQALLKSLQQQPESEGRQNSGDLRPETIKS